MRSLRAPALLAAAVLLAAGDARAEEEKAWAFSAYAYTFFVPGDGDYVQPAVTADRGRLHLEARYQYEDSDTTSVWAGYNFSVGDTVTFEGTAMLGGVFGRTDGIAPGYKASLGWSKLEWYSEGEVLFDTNASSDSFFYAWSELTWAPAEWVRFGLVGQRTRVYETDREIQRGLLLGFSGEHVDVTTYVFNPDDDSPTVVLALGLSF
ncbi:MAG TPA: hypothetical protein VF139_08245 [Candidatus Polarisedimenticolaceae bacterium]